MYYEQKTYLGWKKVCMYFPITPVSLTPKNNRYNLMEVFVLIEVVLSTNHHDVNNKPTKKNSW